MAFFMKKQNLIKFVSIATDSPNDVLTGSSIIKSIGFHEITVENIRDIIEYSSSIVRFHSKEGRIKIAGENLLIEYYSEYEMKIIGSIKEIYFYD